MIRRKVAIFATICALVAMALVILDFLVPGLLLACAAGIAGAYSDEPGGLA